jgi:hypothetical protein
VELFSREDPAMLLPGDGPLVFESYGGPLALRDQGPREPIHVQTEVVQASQIDVRGDGALLEDV